MDRDALALALARGVSVEQIARRFGKHPSTVSYWMRKHGLVALNRDKHAARGGIERARLVELIDAGLSIAGIAAATGRSKGTVRHWLGRHGLQTRHVARRESTPEAAVARAAGAAIFEQRCPRHGVTRFVREGRGYYRCAQCRVESVARHRRKLKEMLIAESGGRCCLCGYDRHPRALEFHHLDPTLKQFSLSQRGVTLSETAMREEASKCVLLCSNCHAEVEAGVASVPIQYARADETLRRSMPQ